ncbi:hypothetical protein Glove_29g4 [Diversispora epigaea]|uniref:Uncharacterized protein n=1 Tax=Diversispora epigaea TaxID=1348612 RepID=A0A397JJR1_9GLOM|nr:hypothetical protein Glove_29g4 [Diversispora epigaea]
MNISNNLYYIIIFPNQIGFKQHLTALFWTLPGKNSKITLDNAGILERWNTGALGATLDNTRILHNTGTLGNRKTRQHLMTLGETLDNTGTPKQPEH